MPHSHTSIQSYSLFGESKHLPDVLHCETIADRSALHDWELAPHRHARLHQILLVKSGGGIVTLEGQTFHLKPGSLVNVPLGHVHAFSFTPNTQGWVTTFADELLDELLMRVGNVRQDLSHASVLQADHLTQEIIGQIWFEFSNEQKSRALLLRGLSAVLLAWVSRHQILPMAPQFLELQQEEKPLVQRFKALIEAHFAAHWQVNDYAKALSISPTHLSRVTRQATGASALRLIEGRLMREARRNLAYTNLSIANIAYTLGYSDPAYFSRVFTRDAGVSPKQFRQQI